MKQKTFFTDKRTGTFADMFLAYGAATILDELLRQGLKQSADEFAIRAATIHDVGGYYTIELSELLQDEWIENCKFFQSPAPYVTNSKNKNQVPFDTPTRDVDETWNAVKVYSDQRGALREKEKGIKSADLRRQLEEYQPPYDWPTVTLLGDFRVQALNTYNRAIEQWGMTREHFAANLEAILQLCVTPSPDLDAIEAAWAKKVKVKGLKRNLTALQLFNPHQVKGQNQPKANALKMGNMDSFWLWEFLKVVGLWQCAAPRTTIDNDRKIYVLAPLHMTVGTTHKNVFEGFSTRLWNEHRGENTAIKMDITSLLLFTQEWLSYVEQEHQEDDYEDEDLDEFIPEKVVAGFHVAQYKLLSRNAYTMTNLSFLRLPEWTGKPRTIRDIIGMKGVIDEHLAVIHGIDEGHSDGYNLLLKYRDFISGGKWDAFFAFAASYSHYLMSELLATQSSYTRVRTFTAKNLEVLMTRTNKKPLGDILHGEYSEGFKNIARAIRLSTITLQYIGRKESPYEIRYGLAQKLQRKAVDDREFAKELNEFVQSYNAENARVRENKPDAWRRKDITTGNIEHIISLIDVYDAETICYMLLAYGYARDPKEDQE